MTIRNITPEDLPILVSLINNEELSHNSICYEHSKLCLDDNGKISVCIIVRQRGLRKYYQGKSSSIKDVHLIRTVRAIPEKKQYEIIGVYINGTQNDFVSEFIKDNICYDGHTPIGLVWAECTILPKEVSEYTFLFIDDIVVSVPYIE